MKIRTRLTLLFTIITATILFIFAFVIYYSASESREKEFYSSLRKEAYTKANLFLNAQVDYKTLQEIYHNNRKTLNEVEVAIYDTTNKLLYHDAIYIDFVKETPQMLQEISDRGYLEFYQEKWQVVGVKYSYQGVDYIITAAAYDESGYNKLETLLKNCGLLFLISILFIYLAGRLFSKKTFEPLRDMINKATSISANNLDLRLSTPNKKDELFELASTFNQMLDRLERSFDAQKHFVSNISHEIRTPLSAIIAELELSMNKERSPEEYKEAIGNALLDAKKLARLSNSLLDLAKASFDTTTIAFKPVRVDEILLDARLLIQQINPAYKIDIQYDGELMVDDSDHKITVKGNEYLLKVAFMNLMENGCKFSSSHQVMVSIGASSGKLLLKFTDNGYGIAKEDITNIFTPFYRVESQASIGGNGIGLSLTQRIIQIHKGDIQVQSKPGVGSVFTVQIDHLPTS